MPSCVKIEIFALTTLLAHLIISSCLTPYHSISMRNCLIQYILLLFLFWLFIAGFALPEDCPSQAVLSQLFSSSMLEQLRLTSLLPWITLLLALPALFSCSWILWNIIFVASALPVIVQYAALTGWAKYVIPSPLGEHDGLIYLLELLAAQPYIIVLLHISLLLGLIFGKYRLLSLGIIIINALIWYASLWSIVDTMRHWSFLPGYLCKRADMIEYLTGFFFYFNAMAMSAIIPLMLLRKKTSLATPPINAIPEDWQGWRREPTAPAQESKKISRLAKRFMPKRKE